MEAVEGVACKAIFIGRCRVLRTGESFFFFNVGIDTW
jgi:hypothetical protein